MSGTDAVVYFWECMFYVVVLPCVAGAAIWLVRRDVRRARRHRKGVNQ